MHLSGQLNDWSVADLLQIMQVTKKTASLDVDGSRKARIHFTEGLVTGAELKTTAGSQLGQDRPSIADVLLVLSSITEGSFSVGPADGPDSQGWSVEEILADVESLKSLEGEVADAGLIEANTIRLVARVDESVEIAPADWETLAPLVAPFTFDELEKRLGRGASVRALSLLHRLGVTDATSDDADEGEDEDEADWLDRLAGRITPQSSGPTWSESSDADPGTLEAEGPESGETADEEQQPAVVKGQADDMRGVSAPASTMLTEGVYDEIRRLRSKVAEG